MIKKGLATMVGMTALSALAAWAANIVTTYSVQTKTINAGGTVQVRSNPALSGGGAIKYTNFTTSAPVAVTVTPGPLHKISAVKKNGVAQAIADPTAPMTLYVQKQAPADPLRPTVLSTQSVVATFAVRSESGVVLKTWQLQTKNVNAGGTITTTRGTDPVKVLGTVGQLVLKNYNDTTPVSVAIATNPGYDVDKVTLNGDPVTLVNGSFKVTPTPTSSKVFTVQATYKKQSRVVTVTQAANGLILPAAVPAPNVQKPQIPAVPPVAYGGSVDLNVIPTGTYNLVNSISVTGQNDVVVSAKDNAGHTVAPFTGPVQLRISNITAPLTVSATYGANHTDEALKNCASSCHLNSVNAKVLAVPDQYLASAHKRAAVDCVTCHKTMPGPDYSTTAAKEALCATCHAPGASANHPAVQGNQSHCSACHTFSGGHNPVRTDVTGTITSTCAECHTAHDGGNAFLKAQYVSAASLPVSCADCHSDTVNTTANQAILAQFAESAHGATSGEAWIHYDWRGGNRSSCARCHTGTAFVAKLGSENNTSNVFLPGDILKPGEALACSACHTNAGTGELRVAAPEFTINMSNGATVTYEVAGASTLCARCHSGRETGASIKADTDATGLRVFVDSHYQPAAGTVYRKAGYEYAGQNYDLGSHKLLGATSQGPCVTCHMAGKNHTFVAASCGFCHGVTAPAVDAANLKATYDAALNNLKLALQAKGIHYGPVHPFFFTAPYVAGGTNAPFTNWASVYGAGRWKDTMGAAFNYNLLWSEKGAYAHNYRYAMKLIADSIDFLSDGSVEGP